MVKCSVFQVSDMTSIGPKKFYVGLQTPTNVLESLPKTIVSPASKQNDRTASQNISEDQNARLLTHFPRTELQPLGVFADMHYAATAICGLKSLLQVQSRIVHYAADVLEVVHAIALCRHVCVRVCVCVG